jgi:ferrochelatase
MIGVILLNMGGPDSLQAIKPFLQNLFADRDIIRLGPPFLQKSLASLIIKLRLNKTIEAYSLIGGKSPLTDITNAQAKALEKSLNASRITHHAKVYVGMRYWHPFIESALQQMKKDGVDKVIALSLYPHYCIATTGSTIKKFKEDMAAVMPDIPYHCIASWYNHPLYIDALVEKITQAMAMFSEKPAVLFSAHSLPQKFVDAGDPYVNEINGTIDAINKKIDIASHLSYQSKTGPVKWLEPTTEQMLKKLADKGIKDLLVAPISFVSDHIETLYEIDMLYKDMAKKLGINLKRVESLNTAPKFIEALKDMVISNADNKGWL